MSGLSNDWSLKHSPTDGQERRQLMSRWHSPNSRQLCRDRLLSRLKQNHEMRSSLVDRMRKVNINDFNDVTDENSCDEVFVDEELQYIIQSDVEMMALSSQEKQELSLEVKQEFLEERRRSWEGLPTKEDQKNSQIFLNALRFKRAVICPYCKSTEMSTTDGYLVCIHCNIRFETRLTVPEIIARMDQILNFHSTSGCSDRFPHFNMFQSNLIIFCDTCPLYQRIL